MWIQQKTKRWKRPVSLLASLALLLSVGGTGMMAQAQEKDELYESFQTPPAQYKSRPLWFWNSDGGSLQNITKEGIREIMVNSKEQSGYFGFGILPNWLQNYMSDEYLELYGYALQTAKELGMKMCLYDENGFPSGSAGGILAKEYPGDTMKRLDKGEADAEGPGEVAVPIPTGEYRTYMGAVAMNTETFETLDISDQAIFMADGVPGVYASSDHPAIGDQSFGAAKAFDGDEGTRWNAAPGGVSNQWLEVCYREPAAVDKVVIKESMDRITDYAFQYFEAGEWKDIQTGSTIGSRRELTFAPVTARRFRLFMNGSDTPSIIELELYNGAAKHPTPQTNETDVDRVVWQAPEGKWKVMTFATVKDGYDRVDYLDPESVDKLIATTHEVYYEHFSEYFGDVIDSAFYDEPMLYQAKGRTWTGRFNQYFQEEYGYNPITLYPALWYDMGEKTASARNALYGFRTRLFAESYIGRMNDWCSAHGISMTGHMDQEEAVNPVTTSGDLMKVFSGQDIPGVDEISFYDRARKAYKVVSSSANNWDKGLVMTEVYGAMGEDMGVPVLYKDIMNQFTRGVNYVVPHAVWYNNKSGVTFPPELSYRSEKYGPELSRYNDFIGRTSLLLQNGRHVADIGVLYPIATLEASTRLDNGDPYHGVTPVEADYMEVGDLLSSTIRKDFTFLHPDVINERCAAVGDTFKLNNTVNYEEYKVLIMPGSKTISWPALQKIKAFYDGGGQVIATTQLPYQSAEAGHDADVVRTIEEMFDIEEKDFHPDDRLQYSASSVFQDNAAYAPEKAFDGVASDGSRWNAGDVSGNDQWLQVDFGETVQADHVVVWENAPYRVTSFRVEYWDGQSWAVCARGTEIGEKQRVDFDQTVSTDKIRLYIETITSDSVSIQELEVYNGDSHNLARPFSGLSRGENAAGGKAVFLGSGYKELLAGALEELHPVSDVEIEDVGELPGGSLSYIHKVKENRNLYYFANSSDQDVETTVRLRGSLQNPMWWNPVTGERTQARCTSEQTGGETVTVCKLSLPQVQSLFLVEAPASEVDETGLEAAIAKAAALDQSLYKNFSAVTAAVEAAEQGRPAESQAAADAMVKAIEDAIKALVYKDADYTAVDAALAKVPKDLTPYTDSSVAALNAALRAVDRTKNITQQATVDGYAAAIEKALRNLDTKAGADYQKVNEALKKAEALDKGLYKDFSAVTAAIEAVVRGRPEEEQAVVDGYAAAIERAIDQLVYKDADYGRVDEALQKAQALDPDAYADFSAVTAAVQAVVRGKNITEQTTVDGYAAAIEDAIASLVPKTDMVPGDLDGDGEVTIQDVMEACKVLARQSAGKAPTSDEMARGDLDGDGKCTITDVMEICKILARKA